VSAEALRALQEDPVSHDAAGYLLQIIERLPACLMRVDLEGQFLAVNQAGLNLLGTQGLEEVLGTSVTARISTTNGGQWTEFARRVWNGAPGSLECSLIGGSGSVRSILFHAIALPDHPDQIPSLLLTARDLSDSRKNDMMAAELAEARAALDERRTHFEGALEEEKGRATQLADELRSEQARREQLESALNERRTQLEGAHEEEKGRGAQLADELKSEQARRQQLESSLDETRQLQASLHESAARLADQHIELKGLREDADHLEPLAAVGRLAFTVSDDVQICLVSAETCVRRLLGQNTGDDTLRADLEVLRRDLSQAARLLRQVARLGVKP
jgi:hypothetical protein